MAPEPGPLMSSLSRIISAFALALAPVLAVGLGALSPRPAAAQDLSALARVDPAGSLVSDRSGGIDLTLALSQGVPWRVFSLAEPDRIVMDFREIDWSGLSRLGMLNSDLAADLRFGTYRPGWSRLVLTLTEPLALSRAGMEVDPATGKARLSARFEKVSAEAFAAQAGAPRDPDWDLPEDGLPRPAPRDGDAPLTVVIDPGHGGIDPGAVQGGLTEKDLMLQLAQAVRETLIREGDTRVILTRNDTYGWIRGEAILLDDVDAPWTTDFGAVDYVKVAEGFGFEAVRITAEDQIEAALRAAIDNPGANFIEISVPSQDEIVPFVPPWVRAAKEKKLPYFY